MTDADPASQSGLLNADEAASRLGISKGSLYAYVSRGLLRSVKVSGQKQKAYYKADIDTLLQNTQLQKSPEQSLQEALHWGLPILETSLCTIRDGRLWYRNHDACELAASSSIEEIAALLWTGDASRHAELFKACPLPDWWKNISLMSAALSPQLRMQQVLVQAQADPDWLPADELQQMACLLRLLAAAWHGSTDPDGCAARISAIIPEQYRDTGTKLISIAVICLADHELNTSTFVARCAASTGSPLPAVILAALCSLRGPLHGGQTEDLVRCIESGAPLPRHAFGHPLYPAGDPRAETLLRSCQSALPDNTVIKGLSAQCAELQTQGWPAPQINLALAALQSALQLPKGSAFALFALARCIGWLGHAREQRVDGRLIRPRANFNSAP